MLQHLVLLDVKRLPVLHKSIVHYFVHFVLKFIGQTVFLRMTCGNCLNPLWALQMPIGTHWIDSREKGTGSRPTWSYLEDTVRSQPLLHYMYAVCSMLLWSLSQIFI